MDERKAAALPAELEGARWIESPLAGGPRTSSPPPYLRRTFVVPEPVRSAMLHVTSLGMHELELNGAPVGSDVFAPGWSDYRRTLYFCTYDVSDMIREGENTLGAILGDGWYCGFVAWRNRQVYGDRPRLLLRLAIITYSGHKMEIVTDRAWSWRVGPLLESDLLMGESYDARLELDGWSSPGASEEGWAPATESTEITHGELLPRVSPLIRRQETLCPISVTDLPDWKGPIRIFDLGQNFAGRVRMRIRAARGRTVRLRHGEMLEHDGSLYTDNLREARADDCYVCRSSEEEVWEPRFTFHGFRYVEATGITHEDELSIEGVVLHSHMEQTGWFSCSNPLLNQLHRNIIWSQKSNFMEVPTDCPQRDERMGWTGDAQIFAQTACLNMDVRKFFHKWMRDVRDAQQPSGGVPCVVPHLDIVEMFDEDGGPAWSDAIVICPWVVYLHYNDLSILRENYDAMRRYVSFLLEYRCVGLIRSHPDVKGWLGYGDWLALDGSSTNFGKTPFDLIGTAFLAHDLWILAETAKRLGDEPNQCTYQALHEKVVVAFQDRFITKDGLIASGTQTSAILALYFGLVPSHCAATVMSDLVTKVRAEGGKLTTGFVGTPFLLEVLEAGGEIDLAYQLLEREELPSWLFQVKHGATSIWERWDAWTPVKGFNSKAMNSYNHYAYGAVGSWLYRTVAGIRLLPDFPGYKRILFHPRPGGSLTWAAASLETPHGITSIRWEQHPNQKLEIEITIPCDCEGEFSPPPSYRLECEPVALTAGKHRFTLTRLH